MHNISRTINLKVLLLSIVVAGYMLVSASVSTALARSPFWAGSLLQEEPTATPVPPTSTPVPPPATPQPPTPTPLPERVIVVEAFADVTGEGGLACSGCDRIFSSSDQIANAADPVPNVDFILRDVETGRLLARQTTAMDTQGRARTRFQIPAGFDREVRVELASTPGGYQLCPNVGQARTIGPDDFILRTHLEQFPFWKGCEAPEPTAPTATPILVVTEPEASPTAGPAVEPSPTSVPSGAPGTLTAVVTAHGLNVRTGPGVNYSRLGAVTGDTQLVLDGRNQSGTWVRGRAAEQDLEGWLSVPYMDIAGDVMTLPVVEAGAPSDVQATATEPAATPTDAGAATVEPTETVIPDKLPVTGEVDIPAWGLLAMAAALLLAMSHMWRWIRGAAANG